MSEPPLTAETEFPRELKAPIATVATPTLWQSSVFLPLAPVFLAVAIANAAVAPMMDAISPNENLAVIVYFSFGVICSQLGLLSLALTLSSQPFWLRLALSLALALMLFGCWWLGFLASLDGNPRSVRDVIQREVGQAICSLPLIFLAAQSPLWLMRTAFGWRLLPVVAGTGIDDELLAVAPDDKLSLRDLFATTALVAVSFSIFRLVPMEARSAKFQEFLVVLALSCMGTATVALVSMVPLLRLFFSFPLMLAWMGWFGYVMIVAFVLLVVPFSGFMGMRLDGRELIGYFSTIFGFAFSLGIAATLLRVLGWQLQRGEG